MKLNDLIDLDHALKVIEGKDAEIARFKIDTQEIMRINNELRAAMLSMRRIIDTTVK